MNPQNITYADVLKNQSGFLNPEMHPTPLIPKAPRIRLSEEAKTKLHAVIKEEPTVASEYKKSGKVVHPQVKPGKMTKSVKHPENLVRKK